jgi:hypothetical protein
MPKWGWWVLGAFAFYYFFLRKSITGGALATGTIGIGTGANATPYPGYPAGYAPPGAQAAGAPQPIIYQQAPVNDTAQLLGGVGQLFTGVGSLAGGVLGALGQSGVFGSSSSSSAGSNWGGGYGGGGMTYASDPVSSSSSDFDFELF